MSAGIKGTSLTSHLALCVVAKPHPDLRQQSTVSRTIGLVTRSIHRKGLRSLAVTSGAGNNAELFANLREPRLTMTKSSTLISLAPELLPIGLQPDFPGGWPRAPLGQCQ